MMKILNRLESASSISAVFCGILLTGMSLFIALEVVLRKFFSISTKGADELSAYTFAIISAWSLAYTLFKKGHIRIDFVYLKLPILIQRICDIIAMVSLAIFVSPMTYYTFKTLETSISRLSKANTPLQTPLWIPQIIWFSGIFFFFIVVIALTLSILKMAFKKQFDQMAFISGCLGLNEEILEENIVSVDSGEDAEGKN